MNTKGLACCLNGPPGCFCYDTYYISRVNGTGNHTTSNCLTVNRTHGGVIYEACDLSSFDTSFMWHEVTYQNDYHEIDSLGWSLGKASGVDNCMGASACQAGEALLMTQCHNEDPHRTRFHFASSADNADMGVLMSDVCTGLCVIIAPGSG